MDEHIPTRVDAFFAPLAKRHANVPFHAIESVMPQPERSAADQAMDRYAMGDDASFAVVYDEVAPRLYRFLLRLARTPETAEDLTQQTFLQMHDARARFVSGSAVMPWAFAIARRLYIDSTRRRKREAVIGASDDNAIDPSAADDNPEVLVSAKRMAVAAEQVLDGLPEVQRTAYLLVREQGLAIAQAAEILGVTVSAVKLRAFRAYEALRAVLGDDREKGRDYE